MSELPARKKAHHLPALTGIRFFAIFHIFLFHLWVLYDMEKAPQFEGLMSGFGDLPASLITFLSHGWISTSFFFLLSGFIQGYLYWTPEGQLSKGRKEFFIARLSRIYPIHLLVLAVTIALILPYVKSTNDSIVTPIFSLGATLTLTQSWYPPLVPIWSWPTWTISTLLFLYLVTPRLMKLLHQLSALNQRRLLFGLPVLSLIPTMVFAGFFPPGSEVSQNWQIFIGSFPLFWLAHYCAGLLLSRAFNISRFNQQWRPRKQRWLSFGDLALVSVICIALFPGIEQEPYKYFFRHGLLMPMFLVIIYDLAMHQGLAARLFSLPGMGFIGEIGYSIFIWQNLIMVMCWVAASINPEAGDVMLIYASIGAVLLGIISTYGIEKPIARAIRKKYLAKV